jgi:hypothetical protein
MSGPRYASRAAMNVAPIHPLSVRASLAATLVLLSSACGEATATTDAVGDGAVDGGSQCGATPIGNCTDDSDCGPGGHCSPSCDPTSSPGPCYLVSFAPCDGPDGSGVTDVYPPAPPPPGAGCFESTDGGPWVQTACACMSQKSCGQGYYCHTACDQCVDDADCAQGTCKYSLADQRWECLVPVCPT